MKLPFSKDLWPGAARRNVQEPETEAPCEAVWDLLSLYADGETSGNETAMVESHIAVCNDCSRDLSFMRTASVVFAETEEVEPPSDLRAAILAATIDKPAAGRRFADTIHRLLDPAPARYGFAAAAGLAGIFVAVAINGGLPPVDGVAENPAVYSPAPRLAVPAPAPMMVTPEEAPAPLAMKPPAGSPSPHGPNRIVEAAGKPQPAHAVTSRTGGSRKAVLAVTRGSKPAVPPRRTAPSASPTFAGGEMKLKSPVLDRQPVPMEEGVTHTADMVVMADPAPMGPTAPPTRVEESRTVTAAPAAAPARLNRILLTSSSAIDAGQIATFAELKRALKYRDADGERVVEQNIQAREIRLPVLRKTF